MLRLDKVMVRIINRSQSGFLKNRNIMDGILALHEILHDTRVRKKRWSHPQTWVEAICCGNAYVALDLRSYKKGSSSER